MPKMTKMGIKKIKSHGGKNDNPIAEWDNKESFMWRINETEFMEKKVDDIFKYKKRYNEINVFVLLLIW